MSSDVYSYSEVPGGYRIGTIDPSVSYSGSTPTGYKSASTNPNPITPSKYNSKDIVEIGRCSFCACCVIKVMISPPVKIIENFAFLNCKDLLEVEIPSTVNTIEHNVFHGCSKISLISFCRLESITTNSNIFNYANSSVIVRVPKNSEISAINDIATKKDLNPNCIFSQYPKRTKGCTCRIKRRFLMSPISIIYQILVLA